MRFFVLFALPSRAKSRPNTHSRPFLQQLVPSTFACDRKSQNPRKTHGFKPFLRSQGDQKTTKNRMEMLSEPLYNKCPMLQPNSTEYRKTLVNYDVFIFFFVSQSTQKWSKDRSKTHPKQAFQKAVARNRSGLGSCGPDGCRNRPNSLKHP